MKIYGKDFEEVFASLTWQYKIVTVAGTAFVIFSIIYCTFVFMKFTATVETKKAPPRVITLHVTENGGGEMDPSMATDGKGHDALVFTGLQHVYGLPENSGFYFFSTFLATNPNSRCNGWAPIGSPVFQGGMDTVLGPDATTPLPQGSWRYETPSIVYDQGDKGREWKVFAYKYFSNSTQGIDRLYNGIVYKYAPTPQGPWSDEQWVLSPAPDRPPLPYSGLVKQYISQLNPALAAFDTFSRPSVVYAGGALFMTLSAFQRGYITPVAVIMLGSTDHGKTWEYMGAPLTTKDVTGLGKQSLAGASLFMHDGQIYLSAVFGTKDTLGDGATIMQIDDPVKGTLVRDAKTGLPVVLNHFKNNSIAPNARGGGFLAYDDGCGKEIGVVMSEFSGSFHKYVLFGTNFAPLEHVDYKKLYENGR